MTMKILLVVGCGCLFLLGCEAKRKIAGQHHARIMKRPGDVPVVKCGEEIMMSCTAEGDPPPDVEWWFYNRQGRNNKTIVHNTGRDGRVKVKVEEFYVVRSTLIIKDAQEEDEGVYQCRASNSELRDDRNLNVYIHWKIEEAPVHKVMCKDGVTTTTTEQIFPASEYNQDVFNDVVDRAMTSAMASTTSSPKVKSFDGKKKADPTEPPVDPPLTSQTKMMTSSNPAKSTPKKNAKIPAPKKPKDKAGNEVEKPPMQRLLKNAPGTEPEVTTASRKMQQKEGLVATTTLATTSGAEGTHWRTKLLMLINFPVAAFTVVLTSF